MTEALNRALRIAIELHADQLDKAGEPYILHVLRVMLGVKGEQERVAAVLHDTVEDAGLELDSIRARFGGAAADAVDALTRRGGESYEAFIERCAANPIARAVKLSDLADNMKLERLGREPTVEDAQRQQKYERARARLMTPLPRLTDDDGEE